MIPHQENTETLAQFGFGCERMTILMDINKKFRDLDKLARICNENPELQKQYNRFWEEFDNTVAAESKYLASLR